MVWKQYLLINNYFHMKLGNVNTNQLIIVSDVNLVLAD